MARKVPEQKIAEQLAELMNNHNFNPAVFANLIVNEQSLYTQDRLVELMTHIIEYQDTRFKIEWDLNKTSQGLMLSSHLAEVIAVHKNPISDTQMSIPFGFIS
jgi:glucuronate isomerase